MSGLRDSAVSAGSSVPRWVLSVRTQARASRDPLGPGSIGIAFSPPCLTFRSSSFARRQESVPEPQGSEPFNCAVSLSLVEEVSTWAHSLLGGTRLLSTIPGPRTATDLICAGVANFLRKRCRRPVVPLQTEMLVFILFFLTSDCPRLTRDFPLRLLCSRPARVKVHRP